MSKKVILDRNNIESSFRLYCYFYKSGKIEEEILISCLAEAYDGLMFEEFQEITGMHEKVLRNLLSRVVSKNILVLNKDLLPGREWLSVKGSRGLYKVHPSIKNLINKNVQEINIVALRSYAYMLFNLKEHKDIIIRNNVSNNNVYGVLGAAIGILMRNIGMLSRDVDIPRDHLQSLNMLGYTSKMGNELNGRAYLLDRVGVAITKK